MAWVRTAVSMISFGFTIYKFFQLELQDRRPMEHAVLGPRGFAVIMIAIGVLALLVATLQHRGSMRMLRAEYGDGAPPFSLALLVAGLFGVLGVIALAAVILRR